MLIRNGQVDGHIVDVRVGGGIVTEAGAGLDRRPREPVLDARGGAVLPGLHDHHCHLRAMAAATTSIVVGPPSVRSAATFGARLAQQAPGRWARAIGYHDSVAGPLDRWRLDALAGDRPARVQHRSGALWVLNSAALRALGIGDAPAPDDPDGLERDERGVATGRLWREDAWLGQRVRAYGADRDRAGPDAFSSVSRAAAAHGVVGFTDATPQGEERELAELADAHAEGVIAQRLRLMRAAAPLGRRLRLPAGVRLGPVKVILDDDRLPSLDGLTGRIRAAHHADDRVAVHCVTAAQMVLAMAAFEEAGPRHGDRIEHAAVVPAGLLPRLRKLGVAVVTQPNFLAERAEQYRREVPAGELGDLWRARSLLAAGVTVAAGTDAPFGGDDPWAAVRAASRRGLAGGPEIGPGERVDAGQALDWFLADPARLDQRRRVRPGAPADLCLLQVPLAAALAEPGSRLVRACIVGGRVVSGGEELEA